MTKTILSIAAAIFLLGAATYAAKADEPTCQIGTEAQFKAEAANHPEVKTSVLSPDNTKALTEKLGGDPPNTDGSKPYTITVIYFDDTVKLVVVQDGCVTAVSPALPKQQFLNMLGLVEAGV